MRAENTDRRAVPPHYLSRRELFGYLALFVVFSIGWGIYDSLKFTHPVAAAIVRIGFEVAVVALVGYLAWGAWYFTLAPLHWPTNQYAKAKGERFRILMRQPYILCVALFLSCAVVGSIGFILVEVIRLILGSTAV
jgi:hypothetical protein